MRVSELRRILRGSTEDLLVEYKREIPTPHKLARTVASMANAKGGTMYLGVEEDSKAKATVYGIEFDGTINLRDKITNIITDRVEPKIPGLQIEVVPVGKKNLVVFVVSIPRTSLVHGAKDDNGWKYYIRRPGRVDELTPSELQKLCGLKGEYRDNGKTRRTLLDTALAIKSEFARFLEEPINQLETILNDKDSFLKTIRHAKACNISRNFVETFCDLKDNINYALEIPHGSLTVGERECLKDINEAIDLYAPQVDGSSGLEELRFGDDRGFVHLSVATWIKYAIKDLRVENHEEIWSSVRSMLVSYDLTLDDLVKMLGEMKIPFAGFYEGAFAEHLERSLRGTTRHLNELIALLSNLQSEFGRFE
jgi:hypothetical protein